uniref:Uncharacterized protein n=1 Tax=Arundo donax TaxID=35708 RepID=A0A0A9DIF2_ARUDO
MPMRTAVLVAMAGWRGGLWWWSASPRGRAARRIFSGQRILCLGTSYGRGQGRSARRGLRW